MMKKAFLSALFTLLSLSAISQIKYQKGYITNQSGQTSEVYIRLDEMADNPTEIQYKLSPDGKINVAGIATISEFGIGESYKYTREKVQIDRSSEELNEISQIRHAEFKEEVLFLRTLAEGDFSLLYYQDGKLKRFFIKNPDESVEQLIYKKYTTGDNIIRKNNRYKQQLMNSLVCKDIKEGDLKNLRYDRSQLLDLFKKYHQCAEKDLKIYFVKKEGDLNLMIKAGVNFTNFGMEQDIYDIVEDYQYQIDPRIGFEIEYILPMANQKVALYMEPSFSMYNADHEIIVATKGSTPSNPGATGGFRAKVNMDYKILDLPLGLRYYMYLNKAYTSKMFVNAGASLNLVFNSSTMVKTYNNESSDFDFNQSWQPTFFAGVGYRYSEKIGIEMRYFPIRPLTDNGGYKLHQNHSFALVVGYTLF